MDYRATDRIGPFVDAALDQHLGEDQMCWEPVVMPIQGVPSLVLMFWFRCPGSDNLQASMRIHDPLTISAEEVSDYVWRMVEQLREARRGREGPAQGLNGHGGPSGLIVPGRGRR